MVEEIRENPRYHGQFKYVDNSGGWGIWLPAGWHRFDMAAPHTGVIFSPYANSYDTSFTAEKTKLEYPVKLDDFDMLKEAFEEGIRALPDVQIESTSSDKGTLLMIMEARFTFTENGATRKRWVKTVFWGNGQLILIAQGENPEEFQHWLGMFFNTMMTVDIA